MTPIEVYAYPVQKIDYDLVILKGVYYNYIEKLGDLSDNDLFKITIHNKRITVKYHKYKQYDYRRFWMLASVWIDEYPVMIIQNAGREGDDHSKFFITDANKYKEMLEYIFSLHIKDLTVETYDLIIDIPNLDNFYGDKLE